MPKNIDMWDGSFDEAKKFAEALVSNIARERRNDILVRFFSERELLIGGNRLFKEQVLWHVLEILDFAGASKI